MYYTRTADPQRFTSATSVVPDELTKTNFKIVQCNSAPASLKYEVGASRWSFTRGRSSRTKSLPGDCCRDSLLSARSGGGSSAVTALRRALRDDRPVSRSSVSLRDWFSDLGFPLGGVDPPWGETLGTSGTVIIAPVCSTGMVGDVALITVSINELLTGFFEGAWRMGALVQRCVA